MRFTQQNLDAAFSLANELAKAKDLQEALQIQSRHAQLQMHAYALQAQELGAMVTAAAQKGKQGSWTGPSLSRVLIKCTRGPTSTI